MRDLISPARPQLGPDEAAAAVGRRIATLCDRLGLEVDGVSVAAASACRVTFTSSHDLERRLLELVAEVQR